LAISGLHISVIGVGLYKLLIRCGISVKLSVFASVVVIGCYGIMTGMSASAVRAIVMFGLHFAANMIGRSYDMLTALSLAAVLLLIEQPKYVEHSGFLFSFSAIIAIGVLLPVLYDNNYKKNKYHKVRQAFASGAAVALVQLPVHLMFYYQFPVCSVFLNLIIIPLATIVMYNGMFCMLIGGILPFLARKAGYVSSVIFWIYEKSCMLCEKAAYGNIIVGKPEIWQVEAYIVMLAALSAIGKKMSSWWKMQWIIVALTLLMLKGGSGLSITAADVGQGDGIHIRSGTGKHYLIDGGSTSKSAVGKYQLIPYLKSQGAGKLEAVFVTHTDQDHCNGIQTLIEESDKGGIKIGCLILPDIGKQGRDEMYEKLRKSAQEHRIAVKYMSRGQYFQDGEMRLTCAHPFAGYDTEEANEYSLVIYLSYGSFTALFTGDVEGRGEEALKKYMERSSLLQGAATLLKVAHHGSGNSTDEEFLEMLDPKIALISCAEKNRYGHPHPELLTRLKEQGCMVYITKDKGAVTICTDGKMVRVKTFR
ncbi:MAG: DNA internalization-related competence protein ComEC/Rec2, partial [Clostridiales bacterium]|nr:DNA internalization-related competence protein ComEC/Rec2 [Clostridiales bacterium]